MRLVLKTAILAADIVATLIQISGGTMFRTLAFAIVTLAASAASAQSWCPNGRCPLPQQQFRQFAPQPQTWCPTCPTQGCPGGACPVPQPQFRQFAPQPAIRQYAPPVQRRVQQPVPQVSQARVTQRVERFNYNKTYTHTSAVQNQRRELQSGPVYYTPGIGSRWTWPAGQDLRDHLRLHGLDAHSANTLSPRQLMQIHDTVHDRSGRNTPHPSDVQRYIR